METAGCGPLSSACLWLECFEAAFSGFSSGELPSAEGSCAPAAAPAPQTRQAAAIAIAPRHRRLFQELHFIATSIADFSHFRRPRRSYPLRSVNEARKDAL
jgi:hypothetical protein